MDDLISRAAAIDEIEERKNANGYRNVAVISELNRLEAYIMRLPPAQPETHEERTETHACDLISRQAAIEIVDRYNKSHMILKGKPMLGAASIVIELEELPSAQPEVLACGEGELIAQPEIVRCKECKHWDGVDTCDVINAPVWDDDFCSMAERRSDE